MTGYGLQVTGDGYGYKCSGSGWGCGFCGGAARASVADSGGREASAAMDGGAGSAVGDIGKALLKKDEHTGPVSAFGFTRRISKDLREIAGLSTLLPKVLSQTEKANFGIL